MVSKTLEWDWCIEVDKLTGDWLKIVGKEMHKLVHVEQQAVAMGKIFIRFSSSSSMKSTLSAYSVFKGKASMGGF